jgi:hypothetical protein
MSWNWNFSEWNIADKVENYVDDSAGVPASDCSLIPIGRYTSPMSFTVKLHQFGYLVTVQRPPRILFLFHVTRGSFQQSDHFLITWINKAEFWRTMKMIFQLRSDETKEVFHEIRDVFGWCAKRGRVWMMSHCADDLVAQFQRRATKNWMI